MGQWGPAIFVGDAAGLDFLNSVATPADATLDWIDDGKGLLSWLEQAQLVPTDVLRKIRAHAPAAELDVSRVRPETCANGSGPLCSSTKAVPWHSPVSRSSSR